MPSSDKKAEINFFADRFGRNKFSDFVATQHFETKNASMFPYQHLIYRNVFLSYIIQVYQLEKELRLDQLGFRFVPIVL